MKISAIIALILSLSAGIIPGISLVSKTNFESTFMTTEQLLKKRFLIILSVALYLAFLIAFFYLLVSYYIKGLSFESLNWPFTVIIAISTFMFTSIFLIFSVKPISNFITKEKAMYKVCIEDLGELYIIKMLDPETCICSYDAHTNLNDLSLKIFLVKIEDLIKLPLEKEIVPVPSRSFYKKLFD